MRPRGPLPEGPGDPPNAPHLEAGRIRPHPISPFDARPASLVDLPVGGASAGTTVPAFHAYDAASSGPDTPTSPCHRRPAATGSPASPFPDGTICRGGFGDRSGRRCPRFQTTLAQAKPKDEGGRQRTPRHALGRGTGPTRPRAVIPVSLPRDVSSG